MITGSPQVKKVQLMELMDNLHLQTGSLLLKIVDCILFPSANKLQIHITFSYTPDITAVIVFRPIPLYVYFFKICNITLIIK